MKFFRSAVVMCGVLGLSLACVAKNADLMLDPATLIAQADTNRDGVISRDEYLAARASQFDRLDVDRDGYLTQSDAATWGGRAERGLAMLLNIADKDGDGRISRVEWNTMPAHGFDRMDTNHDGVLEANELTAAQQRGAWFLHARAGG